MTNISLYFQVHQPYRVRRFTVFDISKSDSYFDEQKNFEVLEKVSKKCYIPTTQMLIELLKKYPDFKIAFSFSGVFLDQVRSYFPELLSLFKRICTSKNVEVLDETYYHSLAFIHSKEEYKEQILLHRQLIDSLFSKKPTTFRNTELVYSNEIADFASSLGYDAILAEGADFVLKGNSPNKVYTNPKKTISVLLKNYRLSDDIAFRFSDKNWKEWPLKAEKYIEWIGQSGFGSDVINLFMDYETFGEHQKASSGIFDFLKEFPNVALKNKLLKFDTPSSVVDALQPVSSVHVLYPISWADEERDLSAWLGNELQEEAFNKLYALQSRVEKCNDPEILKDWEYLQISDHFYYMCTKFFSDGEVHMYFNPYASPYEAFINYMNVLSDFTLRLDKVVPENEMERQISTFQRMLDEKEQKIKKLEAELKIKPVRKSPEKSTQLAEKPKVSRKKRD